MGRQEQDYSVRYWKISVKREGVGKKSERKYCEENRKD